MKKFWPKIKKILRALGVLTLFAGTIFLLSATSSHHKSITCKSLSIDIDRANGNYFINDNDIKSIIEAKVKDSIIGSVISKINFDQIEHKINTIPYIKNVQTYINKKGELKIDINQRSPIVRVINKKGVSYYIDDQGEKMPISDKFTARVPIANGYIIDNDSTEGIIDSPDVKQVYELAMYLKEDQFWEAQVEQIYRDKQKGIIIIPKLGNHSVIIGDVNNLEKKFKDLMLFYNNGLKYMGWYTYKSIDLRYEGQIVCTKY